MSVTLTNKPTKEFPLRLHFPNWSTADTVLNRRRPFSLWLIGDQPLLYHWLDYAVNERYTHVIIHAIEEPSAVRKAMEDATLWPLHWEVLPSNPGENQEAVEVFGLPWANNVEGEKENQMPKGWDLLDHWFRLEDEWLKKAFETDAVPDVNLAVGRNCNIHPTTKLHMPVYIGNNVQIGEGCELGPNASIGSDSMLAGFNRVHHSKIEPRTFLGQQTELNKCYLAGGMLANLRHRAFVPKVESFVADSWSRGDERAGIVERLLALVFWIGLSLRLLFSGNHGNRHTMSTFQGMKLPTYAEAPLWRQRMPWLLEVLKGNCRLFGVLPRTQQQFSSLSSEWQNILATAPVGVFSYADSHGCHSPEDEMEPVHAVYQATRANPDLVAACQQFAWNLILGRKS